MSTAYDAYNIARSEVRSVETRVSGLADAPVDGTVAPEAAPVPACSRAGFGTKATLVTMLALAALGAKAAPVKADISEFPSTKYEWTLTLNGAVGDGLYSWTGLLKNVSTGGADDAGKGLEIFADSLSNISFAGGSQADFWVPTSLDSNKLTAEATSPFGHILPQDINQSQSYLYVTMESQWNTSTNGVVSVFTTDHGNYTFENAQVPGEIPAVPLPGAILLVAAGAPVVAHGLNRENRKKARRG